MKKIKGICMAMSLSITLFLPSVIQAQGNEIEDISQEKRFRAELGLNTDDNFIKDVNKSAAFVERKKLFGIALNDEEFKDLNNRNQVIEDAKKLRDGIIQKSLKDVFGGMYFSHNSSGGVLKVGITQNASKNEIKQTIQSNFPHKNVEFYDTQFSYAQLEEKKNEMDKYFAKDPTKINYLELSVQENKLVISIKDNDPALIADVNEKFGKDFVQFKVDNSWSPVDRAIIGGSGIRSNTKSCTSAFSARGRYDSNYYIVTAGHCGTLGETWYYNGSAIGPVTKYNNVNNSDSMAIQTSSDNTTSRYIGSLSVRPFTEVQQAYSDMVGDYVCSFGDTSKSIRCGTLKNKTMSTGIFGPWMTNLRSASFLSQQGDSGGPVFKESGYNSALAGVLKASGANESIYSQASLVENDLGINAIVGN
ncbi:S1 family peptidase [Paenibacillus ehimensis]|uniref:S1 family peptidase n=1 Tax=Paenibacillus ehimensis TaxID=79264 RepID=UPI000FDB14BF|nr:S1 family peptidase [Paenibacillus ehimensis]